MANHKSAQKRARQTIKREARNTALKSRVKTFVRAFRDALESGEVKKIEAALGTATREIRKAASKGLMHKRAASRHVSRLVMANNKAAKTKKA